MSTAATTGFKHYAVRNYNRLCVVVTIFLWIYVQKSGMLESELHDDVKILKR